MSKIPLADKESLRGDTPKDKRRKFLKGLLIGTIVVILMAVISGLIVYFYLMTFDPPERSPKIIFHILADAFSISGVLGLLFYLLSYVSSQGAFDMLSYSIQYVFLVTFRRNYKKEHFPKTFYDYKVLKDRDGRKSFKGILIPSATFLAIGLIFLIIYMNL